MYTKKTVPYGNGFIHLVHLFPLVSLFRIHPHGTFSASNFFDSFLVLRVENIMSCNMFRLMRGLT